MGRRWREVFERWPIQGSQAPYESTGEDFKGKFLTGVLFGCKYGNYKYYDESHYLSKNHCGYPLLRHHASRKSDESSKYSKENKFEQIFGFTKEIWPSLLFENKCFCFPLSLFVSLSHKKLRSSSPKATILGLLHGSYVHNWIFKKKITPSPQKDFRPYVKHMIFISCLFTE